MLRNIIILFVFIFIVSILSQIKNSLQEDAEFALNELAKLSDSEIYSTLSLINILSSKEEEGIYHYNHIIDVELKSPYFKSGQDTEKFTFILMKNKFDDSVSFAIDEFPVMDETAIEKFWIDKVKHKRSQKDEIFRRLEVEYSIDDEEDNDLW